MTPTFYAEQVDTLIRLLLIVSGVFFTLVIGPTVYFVIRYRSGKVDRPTSTNRGFLPLEVSWAIIPLVVVGFIAAMSSRDVLFENTPPPDAMQVNVVGRRFSWQFEYADLGIKTTNELHLPTHRAVKLNLSSADVIHSFWVPAFRIKQDVVPGVPTFLWFKTEEAGTYQARCAQLCGIGHYLMKATVTVESQKDFNAWVKSQKQKSGP